MRPIAAAALLAATLLLALPGFAQTNSSASPNQPKDREANAGAESPGIEVLSDTMGVDFGPYLTGVQQTVRDNWYNLVPEVARPPISKKGKVAIELAIVKDGSIAGMRLVHSSNDVALDRAAWGGITASNPFPALPEEFKGKYLALRFYFFYDFGPEDIAKLAPKVRQAPSNPNAPFTISPTGPLTVAAGYMKGSSAGPNGSPTFDVTWSIAGDACARSDCGRISKSGMYTAPAKVPDPPKITVTATQTSAPSSLRPRRLRSSNRDMRPNFTAYVAPGLLLFVLSTYAQTNPPTSSFWLPLGFGASAAGAVEIVDDTQGVDLLPYVEASVIKAVRQNWYNVMPEIARAPLMKKGRVAIQVDLMTDGSLANMHTVASRKDKDLDPAAWASITMSSPFPPLPSDFKGHSVTLRFYFFYNPDASDLKSVDSLKISRGPKKIAPGSTYQFSATSAGNKTKMVTWAVTCGTSDCGSISSDGLYTAPATTPNPDQVMVTAKRTTAPFKSASVKIKIAKP